MKDGGFSWGINLERGDYVYFLASEMLNPISGKKQGNFE